MAAGRMGLLMYEMHLPNINQPLEHVYDKMHFTTYLYRCQCYL